MPPRRLIRQNEFNGHPIATEAHHACDKAVLSALENALNQSLAKADFPRMLLMDIRMLGEQKTDVNGIFRTAQAEFVKGEIRHHVGKPRYVGYKSPEDSRCIRLALVYDSKEIRDEAIEMKLSETMGRKVPAGAHVEVRALGDSMYLCDSSFDDVFRQASAISLVPVSDESRNRVLFTSKD